MRPITVSVGPLAGTTNLTTTINPPVGPGQLDMPGNPVGGGSNVSAFVATGCTIAANVLTIGAVTSGKVGPGPIAGSNIALGTTILGPGPSANQWYVSPPQTVAATTVRGRQVVTLDAPRQISITNAETAGPGKFFTIQGTDAAGNPITEVLPTNGNPLLTSQSFATITAVAYSATTVASVAVLTAATATSPWVMFDPYASGGYISKQTVVNGVANYTVQVSYDDPNAPGGPLPAAMGWLNDTDATFVGATTSLTGSWPYTPLWARVLLNSGAGSVRATFIQPGNLGR